MGLRYGIVAILSAALLAMSAGAAAAVDAVANTAANVRAGPGTGYAVVDTLRRGELLEVLECNSAGTWCRIAHPGPDGWVARRLLSAAAEASGSESGVEFGMTIPLPGGGSITFGTPGYQPPQPMPPPKRVCVYYLPDYTGASICVNAGMSATSIAGFWNDRVTSLRVFGGAHIRLCQDITFGGFCNVFSANVPQLGVPLNNKASSYQVW